MITQATTRSHRARGCRILELETAASRVAVPTMTFSGTG